MSRMRHGSDSSNRLPFIVSALGVLIALVPVISLPSSSGAVAFAVLAIKGIGILVGLGVVGVGIHSYHTGDRRLAAVTGVTVLGLFVVGVVGGLIEATTDLLVPIRAWFSSAILVIGLAYTMVARFVDEGR